MRQFISGPQTSQWLAREWPVWGTHHAPRQMDPGETAYEGNGMDAVRRTAGPSQHQVTHKVRSQVQRQGLQGLEETWDRR